MKEALDCHNAFTAKDHAAGLACLQAVCGAEMTDSKALARKWAQGG